MSEEDSITKVKTVKIRPQLPEKPQELIGKRISVEVVEKNEEAFESDSIEKNDSVEQSLIEPSISSSTNNDDSVIIPEIKPESSSDEIQNEPEQQQSDLQTKASSRNRSVALSLQESKKKKIFSFS